MNQVGPFGCDYNRDDRGLICTYSARWILTSGGRTRRACGQHFNYVADKFLEESSEEVVLERAS